jgi:hypothetical protein
MPRILIHENKIYDADEWDYSDFEDLLIEVEYSIEYETDVYEGHGLRTITNRFISISYASLTYSSPNGSCTSVISDHKALLKLLNSLHDDD